MRLTVTHIRIIVLALNLLLAGGVFAYASYSYWGLTRTKTDDMKPLDPKDFVVKAGQIGRSTTGAAVLESVAPWLQPQPPVVKPPPDPTAGAATEAAKEEPVPGELPEGPLGEQGWQYTGFFGVPDQPLLTRVILTKKVDPAAGAQPGRPGARPTTYRPPTASSSRVVRSGSIQVRRPGQADDRLSFVIGEREFYNPELSLHFRLHSADDTRFVYWIPDADGVKGSRPFYALPYVTPPGILSEPEKGLRGAPTQDLAAAGVPNLAAAAGAAGGTELPKRTAFIEYPVGSDPEEDFQTEYLGTVEGKPEGPVMKSRAQPPAPADPEAEASGASAPGSAATARPPAPSSPGPAPATAAPGGSGPTVSSPPPSDEEVQKLQEVLSSPKISPADREELRKALGGARSGGGTRRR